MEEQAHGRFNLCSHSAGKIDEFDLTLCFLTGCSKRKGEIKAAEGVIKEMYSMLNVPQMNPSFKNFASLLQETMISLPCFPIEEIHLEMDNFSANPSKLTSTLWVHPAVPNLLQMTWQPTIEARIEPTVPQALM